MTTGKPKCAVEGCDNKVTHAVRDMFEVLPTGGIELWEPGANIRYGCDQHLQESREYPL